MSGNGLKGQILPRQLVVFERGALDNIPRRNTESRCAFPRPERPEIVKHGREPLRVVRSPLLRRIVVQVAQGPEVEQLIAGCGSQYVFPSSLNYPYHWL